jgi:hypothetical protein
MSVIIGQLSRSHRARDATERAAILKTKMMLMQPDVKIKLLSPRGRKAMASDRSFAVKLRRRKRKMNVRAGGFFIDIKASISP